MSYSQCQSCGEEYRLNPSIFFKIPNPAQAQKYLESGQSQQSQQSHVFEIEGGTLAIGSSIQEALSRILPGLESHRRDVAGSIIDDYREEVVAYKNDIKIWKRDPSIGKQPQLPNPGSPEGFEETMQVSLRSAESYFKKTLKQLFREMDDLDKKFALMPPPSQLYWKEQMRWFAACLVMGQERTFELYYQTKEDYAYYEPTERVYERKKALFSGLAHTQRQKVLRLCEKGLSFSYISKQTGALIDQIENWCVMSFPMTLDPSLLHQSSWPPLLQEPGGPQYPPDTIGGL